MPSMADPVDFWEGPRVAPTVSPRLDAISGCVVAWDWSVCREGQAARIKDLEARAQAESLKGGERPLIP